MATGVYHDKIFTFRYNVIRFWEEQPEDYLDDINIYPFIPLMEKGEDYLEKAEMAIYKNTEMSMEIKGDMLTALAIFAGLKDKNLIAQLIKRRRDIMIRSAAYDIIKEEGIKEGIQEGIQQSLFDALETKFGTIPAKLTETINDIANTEIIRILHRHAIKCNSIEEFENKMQLIIGD